jgi:hypothetical protein
MDPEETIFEVEEAMSKCVDYLIHEFAGVRTARKHIGWAVHALPDGVLATMGFVALAFFRVPPLVVVLVLMLSGLV